MKTTLRTLLPIALLGGCLEPLADDAPGYSPRVLSPDASAGEPGTAMSRSIAAEDGVDGPHVARLTGYMEGRSVQYWDFGPAPGVTKAAFSLHKCEGDEVKAAVDHPLLVSAVPGDADYSPFLALQPVCVSDTYAGERITSPRALRDAIDIGLVEEPRTPLEWLDAPVVAPGLVLEGARNRSQPVFYDGLEVTSLRPTESFEWRSKFVPAGRVYELRRASTPDVVEQVIFGPGFTPLWNVVTVIVLDSTAMSAFSSEADLFEVDEEGMLTPVAIVIESFEVTRDRVHRAIAPEEE